MDSRDRDVIVAELTARPFPFNVGGWDTDRELTLDLAYYHVPEYTTAPEAALDLLEWVTQRGWLPTITYREGIYGVVLNRESNDDRVEGVGRVTSDGGPSRAFCEAVCLATLRAVGVVID